MEVISDIFRRAVPFSVASFVLIQATPAIFDIGMFWYFYPQEAPPPEPEPVGGLLGKLEKLAQRKVYTKSGTYRITAPTPEHLTKQKQQKLCQLYVEEYEKDHNTWRGKLLYAPFIKRVCGISLDDILNNTHGGTNN